jgi:hypothetical protein
MHLLVEKCWLRRFLLSCMKTCGQIKGVAFEKTCILIPGVEYLTWFGSKVVLGLWEEAIICLSYCLYLSVEERIVTRFLISSIIEFTISLWHCLYKFAKRFGRVECHTHTNFFIMDMCANTCVYDGFHCWFVVLILFELDSTIENLYPELRGAVLVCSVPPSGNR